MDNVTIFAQFIFAVFVFTDNVIGKIHDPHMMFEMEETPTFLPQRQIKENIPLFSSPPRLNSSRYSLLHKQLVVSFWRQVSDSFIFDNEDEHNYLYATIYFNTKMRQAVERYLHSSSDNAEEVNNVFMDMFINLTVKNPHKERNLSPEDRSNVNYSFSAYIDHTYIVYGLILLSMVYVFFLFVTSGRFRKFIVSWHMVIVIVFIVSVIWNWYRLYKEATAERQAFIQNELANHRECNGISKINWFSSLSLWFNQQFSIKKTDPCAEAMKKILVDPFWDVTPLDAVSETLSRFVLYPCGKLGESIGLFFQKLNEFLPVWMIPIACVSLLLSFVVLLAVCRGYSLRIPCMFHFEAPKVHHPLHVAAPYHVPHSPPRAQLMGTSNCRKYLKAFRWKQQVIKHHRLHRDE